MADRRFARIVEHFVLVKVDTTNGKSDAAKTLMLKRNSAYVIVFSSNGVELLRMRNVRTLEPIVDKLIEAEKSTRTHRTKWMNRLLAYLRTYQAITAELEKRVATEAELLGSEEFNVRESATKTLQQLGAVSFRLLKDNEPSDPEIHRRVKRILSQYQPLHDAITVLALDRDVLSLAELSSTNPDAQHRLLTILPRTTPKTNIVSWWETNRSRYRWNAKEDRYTLRVTPSR